MTEISDEFMLEQLTLSKGYALVVLKAGPKYGTEGADRIVWEHARRSFQLRAEGHLSIVGPVRDDSSLCGIGIFDGEVEQVAELMNADPGVQAGLFTFEVHPMRSFPGDVLP
jgi:uncharacterized protein YciI